MLLLVRSNGPETQPTALAHAEPSSPGQVTIDPLASDTPCLECHSVNRSQVLPVVPETSHPDHDLISRTEAQFSRVGQHLLQQDHLLDRRYRAPMHAFWQVHLQGLPSDASTASSALARLVRIEQQIYRIDYEIQSGRLDRSYNNKAMAVRAALQTTQRFTPVHHQTDRVVITTGQIRPADQWSDVKPAQSGSRSCVPRGPPTTGWTCRIVQPGDWSSVAVYRWSSPFCFSRLGAPGQLAGMAGTVDVS